MAYTIKEIAELAGVSPGTVDRVIHGRGKVRPETEDRVKRIVDLINYHPNTLAQSLALKKKRFTIGVVVHVQEDYVNYTVSHALEGVQAALDEYADCGFSAIMFRARNFDAAHQAELIDQAVRQNICALLIMPIHAPVICEKLDEVIAAGIPVMCFNNDVPTKLPHYFCGNDAYSIGRISAGMLNLAHPDKTNIGIFSSSMSLLGNTSRNKGFLDTLNEHYPQHSVRFIHELPNDDIESYLRAKQILSEHKDGINAVLIASGAHGSILRALRDLDMLEKLTIVSIDAPDCIVEELKKGRIAAVVSQNAFQHGFQSVKTICNMVFNHQFPANDHIVIRSSILIKEHFLDGLEPDAL